MADFPCTSCGLCCRNVRNALTWDAPKFMHRAIAEFPYMVMPDGSCEKMVGNQCSVYDDRPLLCDIERLFGEVDNGMNRQEWFDLNEQGCDKLKAGAVRLNIRNVLQMEIR